MRNAGSVTRASNALSLGRRKRVNAAYGKQIGFFTQSLSSTLLAGYRYNILERDDIGMVAPVRGATLS